MNTQPYQYQTPPKIERAQECLDRGLVLAMFGDRESAVRLYRKALLLDPNNALGHYMLGKMLMDQGQELDALDEWREATLTNRVDGSAVWAKRECEELINRYQGD